MSYRLVCIFLAVSLCVAAWPSGNTAVTKVQQSSGGSYVVISATSVPTLLVYTNDYTEQYYYEDGYSDVDSYSAMYQEGQSVYLDAYSVESDTYYAPTSDGGWAETVDFYYSDSASSRSDGAALTEAVYELDRSNNSSLLYVTLGGVTLTYDLYAEQVYPLTEDEQRRLEAWATSDEARLAQDTMVGFLSQDYQPTDLDIFLGFAITAMHIDPATDAVAAAKGGRKDVADARGRKAAPMRGALGKFMSRLSGVADVNLLQPCSAASVSAFTGGVDTSGGFLAAKGGLGSSVVRQSNCFGCCGLGCKCFKDRYGRLIYSNACATHDRCVRNYPTGVGFVMADCQILLIPAAVVVFARATPRIIIIRR